MARSIYDLVYEYIDIFFPNEKLKGSEKKIVHKEIKLLLKDGWCEDELISNFRIFRRKNREVRTLHARKTCVKKSKKRKNLLDCSEFYYHNDLRLTSPPPKREIDYDSGEIKVINEPYFLEMKASYSVEDLVKYYGRQCGLRLRDDEIRRYAGSFNWLLKIYTVDAILFMIDAAVNICRSEDQPLPRSPLGIQDYERSARENYDKKKTETVISGSDKVVRKPRKRNLRTG